MRVGGGASTPTGDAGLGRGGGVVSTLHFPVSLAGTRVPLLDNWTLPRRLGALFLLTSGLRNFEGFSLQETFVHLACYFWQGK